MLRFLRIKRLAVIDSVEVEFDPGLNVLTGETGAGKSILVEAVGLLLGGRASGDLVRTGEEPADHRSDLRAAAGDELLVRREITAQGRSRAFINGELATAGALKELSGAAHRAARSARASDAARSRRPISPSSMRSAGSSRWLTPAATAFDGLRAAADELARVRTAVADRGARQELAAFQLAELDARRPASAGEDEELAATRQVLASAERVERLCAESYASLYESDDADSRRPRRRLAAGGGAGGARSAVPAVSRRARRHQVAARGSRALPAALRRRHRGVAGAAAAGRGAAGAARAAQAEVRADAGRRHRAGATRSGASSTDLEHGDERVAELERGVRRRRARATSSGRRRLSEAPARVAAEFARRARSSCSRSWPWSARGSRCGSRPSLPETRVDRAQGSTRRSSSCRRIPGEDLRPLARIVSGGELSRIMLAIKTLTATSRHGFSEAGERPPSAAAPGLIFDEVDAGIGGRVADVVGRKLRALGSAFQVLCITHLPQIAAYADTHFEIEKRVERGRTRDDASRGSTRPGRVEETGRMLGGAAITDGIRASAREMLERAPGRRQRPSPTARGESERAKGESRRDRRPKARTEDTVTWRGNT